jgi:ergothioneine biosynthesis protein EgtB
MKVEFCADPLTISRYLDVRGLTERLAAPLSAEDQTVQSMPDVSPTKWHRAHTSWFFEEFVLGQFAKKFAVYNPAYSYLFNSYYETVGPRYPRVQRGLISRPGAAEVGAYRGYVDEAMLQLIDAGLTPASEGLVELGLHHEQQHQELLLMDIKNVLWSNPLYPAYLGRAIARPATSPSSALAWVEHPGGLVEVGHDASSFAFDNELPRHRSQLIPFALADRPVSAADWLEFMAEDGYQRPELWLSDGWATVQAQGWRSPLYWFEDGGDWAVFTLHGPVPIDPGAPVVHVSYYEADAYARWRGARLPTEPEWEAVSATHMRGVWSEAGRAGWKPARADAADPEAEQAALIDRLHPAAAAVSGGPLGVGEVWEWTGSAYLPYPGFSPAPGAVGEYNGKFMVNQHVLRGGCCISPPGHVRATYRNFFPPSARWPFAGLRLARDL